MGESQEGGGQLTGQSSKEMVASVLGCSRGSLAAPSPCLGTRVQKLGGSSNGSQVNLTPARGHSGAAWEVPLRTAPTQGQISEGPEAVLGATPYPPPTAVPSATEACLTRPGPSTSQTRSFT